MSALLVAFESVAVEGAIRIADLSVFLVSATPSIVGGLILLGLFPRKSKSFASMLGPRGWSAMVILCGLVAAGVFMWFDAVGRIGASKEAILGGGSSEVLFIVVLSALFLGERLSRLEVLGSFLVVIGVFIVLSNVDELSFGLGLGEVEAIVSSLVLAVSVVFTTVLLRSHDLTALSGLELLMSGCFMMLFGSAAGLIRWPDACGWLLVVALGAFPAVGLLTYNAGLPKIGASLTSVLFALNGVITLGVQLLVLLLFPHADIRLPAVVGLALAGGAIAFVGVYLLNMRPSAGAAERMEGRGAEGEI